MKTFEEALRAVSLVRSGNEDMIRANQLSWIAEVGACATLNEIGGKVGDWFIEQLSTGRLPVDTAFHSMYMNGVALGVAIGIEMERTSLDEPL